MKKILSLLLVFVLSLANLSVSYAAEQSVLTKEFVKEANLSVTKDQYGESVILLTTVEELSTSSRAGTKNYAQTTIAILGENEGKTAKIIDNIRSIQRGNGNYTEDDWFYGSSVYLSSTIYYTTTPLDLGYSAAAINKVSIQCTTNSGSSISKMTLTMVQNGPCYPDGVTRQQKKDFDAKTARSFTAPSSWYPVDMSSSFTTVSATIECTAVRPGGTSSTFRLPNHLIV